MNKGLLYEGFKVVPYSTRAGTTLSNAEVALGGYKPFIDPAITVEFPLKEDPKTIIISLDDNSLDYSLKSRIS